MAFFNRSEGQQIGKLFEKLSLPINAKEKITRIKSWLKEQEKSGRSNPLEALRREFPKLRENTFSSEDNLLDYLSNSLNRERLLSQLTPEQKAELSQIQPAITEEAGAQPVGQEAQAAEAPQAVPPTTGQATGMPSMPTAGYTPPARQAKYVVVMPEKTPEKAETPETMEGQGEKPQATPGEQQETMAPKTEASHGQPPNLPSQAAPATSSFQTEKPHKGPAQLQTGWRSSAKTGLSNFGIFFKKASTKLGQGLSAFARPAGGFLGGLLGGGGSFLGKELNRVPNIFDNRINLIGRGRGVLGNAGGNIGKVAKGRLKWLFLVIIMFGFAFGLVTSSNPTGQPVSTAPITGTGDISKCQFTRAGNSQSIKSPTLINWINSAAATAGIPPQILASVAMHESQDFTSTADDVSHYADEIKNNSYCNPSKVMCINKENTGTLYPTDDGLDHPCTKEDQKNGARTAQSFGMMQNINIYNPGKNLCSITENLAIAAAKLKTDGITAQPIAAEVYSAISKYHNGCPYGSYDYCGEVWGDYQKCQTTSPLANCSKTVQAPPPTFTDLGAIGYTRNTNIPINAFQLGNGPIHVAIVGGMNGTQEQSGIDMVKVIKDAFKTGGAYSIPADLTVYLIPEITPDSKDGFNNRGQDINRNFESLSVSGGAWNRLGCSIGRYTSAPGSYLTSCQDDKHDTKNDFSVYCQTIAPGAPDSTNQFTCAPNKTGYGRPYTEAETQSIVAFVDQKQISTVISYRAPYDNITSSNAPPGQKLNGVDDLANLFASKLGTKYDQYFTQYPVPGQFMDWLQDKGVVGIEIELPSVTLTDDVKTKNLQAVQRALNSLSKVGITSQSSCPLVSCPLSQYGNGSFAITCGTFNNPVSNCGHGGVGYPACDPSLYATCPYSDPLKAAIDVRAAGTSGNNMPVYLPFINGNPVDWTLASGPTTLNGGVWGVKLEYTATTNDGKRLQLDLTHMDPDINPLAKRSGDMVGMTKAGVDGFDKSGGPIGSHLHTAVSLNGIWLDAISEAQMCKQQ